MVQWLERRKEVRIGVYRSLEGEGGNPYSDLSLLEAHCPQHPESARAGYPAAVWGHECHAMSCGCLHLEWEETLRPA